MYGYESLYDTADYADMVGVGAALAGFGVGVWIFTMAIGIFMIVTMWKLFSKAGRPGWAAIVPIYNIIVMIDIAGLEWWYLLLLLIPIANIFAMFKIYIGIANNFGQSTGFGVLMVFFSIICMPILAFGSAEYEG